MGSAEADKGTGEGAAGRVGRTGSRGGSRCGVGWGHPLDIFFFAFRMVFMWLGL